MKRAIFLLIILMCISPGLRGQREPDRVACYASEQDNAPHKEKLWDGYEISLGPVANPEEVENKCTAAIYNRAGRVVFRTNGFNVVFDEDLTGEDFDGDGKPDVVFRTDTGGGMHCCWGTLFFHFRPNPASSSRSPWKAQSIFRKTTTGRW